MFKTPKKNIQLLLTDHSPVFKNVHHVLIKTKEKRKTKEKAGKKGKINKKSTKGIQKIKQQTCNALPQTERPTYYLSLLFVAADGI